MYFRANSPECKFSQDPLIGLIKLTNLFPFKGGTLLKSTLDDTLPSITIMCLVAIEVSLPSLSEKLLLLKRLQ